MGRGDSSLTLRMTRMVVLRHPAAKWRTSSL